VVAVARSPAGVKLQLGFALANNFGNLDVFAARSNGKVYKPRGSTSTKATAVWRRAFLAIAA
jgi:hypothetical protein